MLAKVTFIFNAQKNGWSETWYRNSTSIEEALSAAKRVAKTRIGLLGAGSSMEAVRVSDEAILGDSLVDTSVEKKEDKVSGVLVRDTPWNAILCRVSAGSLYRRSVWLRGVPDDWIKVDPDTFDKTIADACRKNFDKFVKDLVAENFAIRALSKSPTDAGPFPISDITKENGTGFTVIKTNTGVLQDLDYIRVRGVRGDGLSSVQGIWQVFNRSALSVTIRNVLPDGTLYRGKGQVFKRFYGYFPVTEGATLRFSKRSTGRAFFVTRGRR